MPMFIFNAVLTTEHGDKTYLHAFAALRRSVVEGGPCNSVNVDQVVKVRSRQHEGKNPPVRGVQIKTHG